MKCSVLVIGANGQIGSVLTQALCREWTHAQVIASDLRFPSEEHPTEFVMLDATDKHALHEIVRSYTITHIFHLAAMLSAKGEEAPQRAWQVNMDALLNVLEVARTENIAQVFFPSSIAVFGADAKKRATPQDSPLIPETVYGISKVAGENWCAYYHRRYGVDVRSLRFPGVISHQSPPGGGTTDYAVEIFHHAIKGESYRCFLAATTRLPMIYIDDVIRATLEFMEAPCERIKLRTGYNLGAISFTPAEIAAEIKRHVEDFEIDYAPDFRQAIAETWPESIDDSVARNDWGWQHRFDLARLTVDMLQQLQAKAKLTLTNQLI